MNLILHEPGQPCTLTESYKRALSSGTEVLIVNAYLTNWDTSLVLGKQCSYFRMIVGRDYGLTRKKACQDVLRWLPPRQKVNFRVADHISGFHPKAVFWKEGNGNAFVLVGSSNLSVAAFESNYEVNTVAELNKEEYENARRWVNGILRLSTPISDDWLGKYREAKLVGGGGGKKGQPRDDNPVFTIKLPRPSGSMQNVKKRRAQIQVHGRHQPALNSLFRACASGKVSSADFYTKLADHWNYEIGNRLQGAGFEIKGKHSDFQEISRSFVAIAAASDDDRDDIASEEIDRLAALKHPARRAFLSEMLCLEFPSQYPLLNKPVQAFLQDIKFTGAGSASEGGRYIDIATRLRLALEQNPKHPAKNLAELDAVIWAKYG